MTKTINLTIPLYPGMPVGNVWAWDAPFRQEPIVTLENNGVRIDALSFHSETGTRLMMAATIDEGAPTIGQLDVGQFVNRDAVVIDIPKGPEEEITLDDIDRFVTPDPDYRDGDIVLIRTGWGNEKRYEKLGDDYAVRTPHFSEAGSMRLTEIMKAKNSDTVAIDVAYVGSCGWKHMKKEWVDLPPWLRPPFPSETAKIYLKNYTKEKSWPDWAASWPLHAHGYIIAALCNLDLISQKRVKITALPLMVRDSIGAPVTVVAIEE
ncbi:cyclase family protein [Alicyclobacillus tolerans]|uniref:cyclase family protein n=1 Tax=Alicyclobacillus tolerans TaxID=90970 RepID=UPI001F011E48|nr:cyclase family protein [Alicyclobacillus tolerans]MCF8565035.1 cyclase family protein [Alicyclobacillus tolerans]